MQLLIASGVKRASAGSSASAGNSNGDATISPPPPPPPPPGAIVNAWDLAETTHVDVADGHCRLVIPTIPDRVELQAATTQPPTTTSTLDIFGEDGPGHGGLVQSPAARGAHHRTADPASGLLLGLLLVATFLPMRRG